MTVDTLVRVQALTEAEAYRRVRDMAEQWGDLAQREFERSGSEEAYGRLQAYEAIVMRCELWIGAIEA